MIAYAALVVLVAGLIVVINLLVNPLPPRVKHDKQEQNPRRTDYDPNPEVRLGGLSVNGVEVWPQPGDKLHERNPKRD